MMTYVYFVILLYLLKDLNNSNPSFITVRSESFDLSPPINSSYLVNTTVVLGGNLNENTTSLVLRIRTNATAGYRY